MLRSAHMLGNEEEIIFTATDLLADTKLAPELANEAHYYRAKAYLDAGKTDGAMEDPVSYTHLYAAKIQERKKTD